MELRHLKYFLVLADELHFGKAAEKLFIAQPPLSRQIKILEKELGVQLFERNSKKVQMTRFGQYLQTEASKLFHDINLMKNHLTSMKNGIIGDLRIGYIATAMYSILPEILCQLSENFPDVHPKLFELDNSELIRLLKSGDLDVAFIRLPINDKSFNCDLIYNEPFSLILSNKHPLSKMNTIDFKVLANEAYIGFTRTCAPMKGALNICRKNGFVPNVMHETTQVHSILKLVEKNMGYSIIPSTIMEAYKFDDIKSYDLSNYNEYIKLSVAYNPKKSSQTILNFIKLLNKVWQKKSKINASEPEIIS